MFFHLEHSPRSVIYLFFFFLPLKITSLKLSKSVTYPGLEVLSLCRNSSMSLHVPRGLTGRAGSEVSTDHIFSWGALEAALRGMHRVEVRARCELGLLPGSTAVATLSEWGQGSRNWIQRIDGARLFPSMLMLSALVGEMMEWKSELAAFLPTTVVVST